MFPYKLLEHFLNWKKTILLHTCFLWHKYIRRIKKGQCENFSGTGVFKSLPAKIWPKKSCYFFYEFQSLFFFFLKNLFFIFFLFHPAFLFLLNLFQTLSPPKSFLFLQFCLFNFFKWLPIWEKSCFISENVFFTRKQFFFFKVRRREFNWNSLKHLIRLT